MLKSVDSVEKKVASSEVMEKVLEIVSEEFNLGEEYTMLAFKDGANTCQVTLANGLYEVSVKLKNKELMGLDRKSVV